MPEHKQGSQVRYLKILFPIALLLLLPACKTSPAPEPHGKWYPVNRFPAQTQAIRLSAAYVFYVTPMDGTLKNLLTRWARDSNMQLQYGIDMDYTLHAPAAQIRTSNMSDALAQLSALYRGQGVEIRTSPGLIVVAAPVPSGDGAASN